MHLTKLLFIIGSSLLMLAGCGEARPFESAIVHGSVSYNGRPIDNGEIRFYPSNGTKGPVSGGPIKNGKYEAKAKGGVPVGSHVVRIQAFQQGEANSAELPEEVAEDFGPSLEQFLPLKFNTDSELVAEIAPGSERQMVDFELKD